MDAKRKDVTYEAAGSESRRPSRCDRIRGVGLLVSFRLLAMGLTRGSVVKVIKVAPLGDPVKIEVRGYDLSLRKAEADALLVESGQ